MFHSDKLLLSLAEDRDWEFYRSLDATLTCVAITPGYSGKWSVFERCASIIHSGKINFTLLWKYHFTLTHHFAGKKKFQKRVQSTAGMFFMKIKLQVWAAFLFFKSLHSHFVSDFVNNIMVSKRQSAWYMCRKTEQNTNEKSLQGESFSGFGETQKSTFKHFGNHYIFCFMSSGVVGLRNYLRHQRSLLSTVPKGSLQQFQRKLRINWTDATDHKKWLSLRLLNDWNTESRMMLCSEGGQRLFFGEILLFSGESFQWWIF